MAQHGGGRGHVAGWALALLGISTAGLVHCSSASTEPESEAQAESDALETSAAAKRQVSFLVASDLHFGYSSSTASATTNDEENVGDDDDDESAAAEDTTGRYILKKNQELAVAMEDAYTSGRARLLEHDIDNRFRGVIVTGDVADNGESAQWAQYTSTFGPSYKLPMYETQGNHDYPWTMSSHGYSDGSKVYDIDRIIGRNTKTNRPGLLRSDDESGSYAWKWDDVVFVNLGVKASDKDDSKVVKPEGIRYTNPFNSLDFLKKVLEQVGKDAPVVLSFHYPVKAGKERMTKGERRDLYEAIEHFHVIAILHGHRHVASLSSWCGVPVFEVDTPRNAAPGYDTSFVAVGITGKMMAAQTVSYRYVEGSAPIVSYDSIHSGTTAAKKAEFCNSRKQGDTCWRYPATDISTIKVEPSCNVDE